MMKCCIFTATPSKLQQNFTMWLIAAIIILVPVWCIAEQPLDHCVGFTVCDVNSCQVTHDSFCGLQEIIGSDRVITLDEEVFTVEKVYDFISIESITNLTITGRESGTLIQCFPQSSFGFYISNATDVTFTGLTFENCGANAVFEATICDVGRCPSMCIQNVIVNSTFYVEESSSVALLNVHILNSPAFAVTVTNILSVRSNDQENPTEFDLIVSNCTISGSQQGSLMLNRTRSLLTDTFLSNSSVGIMSDWTELKLENVVASQCSSSVLMNGDLTTNGTLTMNQSSINIKHQRLFINSTRVNFIGSPDTREYFTGFIAAGSTLFIQGNSTLIFTRFNLTSPSSAFLLVGSNLEMNDNSTLMFTSNSASARASVFTILDSNFTMRDDTSLQVTQNFAKQGWVILLAFQSDWVTKNRAVIDISENFAYDGGRIADFSTSQLSIFHSASISFWNNLVKNDSIIAHIFNATVGFHDKSGLNIFTNTAIDKSVMLSVAGSIESFSTNVSLMVANNSAEVDSKIIALYKSVWLVKVFYYSSVLEVYKHEKNTFFGGINDLLNDIYYYCILKTIVLINTLTFDIRPTVEQLHFVPWSTQKLRGNFLKEQSIGLKSIDSDIVATSGNMVFSMKFCQSSSVLMYLNNSLTILNRRSFVNFTQNEILRDSSLLLSFDGFLRIGPDSELLVAKNSAKNGFSLLFFSVNVSFNGLVRLANNNLSDFGTLNIFKSVVWFEGILEVEGNRAESGAITADNSELYLTNTTTFSDNWAANGGALTLTSSVMYISPTATVDFIRNQAGGLGGAIYISKPRQTYVCDAHMATTASCSIQVLPSNTSCELFSLTFQHNKASIAGNAIYGGRTSACLPSSRDDFCLDCPFPENSTELSMFTSDPTRLCFCEDGVPNCYKVLKTITAHPGELFDLSLAIVGYGLGTVPGSVIARGNEKVSLLGSKLQYSQEIRGRKCHSVSYSIVSERDKEQIALAVNTQSFVFSLKRVNAVVKFQQTKNLLKANPILRSPYDSIFETFFHIPVFSEVDLLPCPVGFQSEKGTCVCHQILQEHNINSCYFSNGTALILRPAPYWIGLPNDTNSSIIIHTNCPFDYCQSEDIEIAAESIDNQCQYQRSGVLCGSCREGLSMILGSSECKPCPNAYLAFISIFIMMGLVLVALLSFLDMTVSVGTLNGLILFANILQTNRTTFLPPATSDSNALVAFLSAFIAWLNLDLGIPVCFYNGLTTYVKAWLQFVFPLYIFALVGAIIIASYFSSRVTQLLGTNAVSVLATLVVLSYTKIIRILITAFSFTTLTGSQGYHSVVWLANANIKYFEPKHAILFFIALLVLLLAITFTVTLNAAPWIQRSKLSRVSSLYNKFKPLFYAYMGPYKDKYCYWTGMLLLARVALIVLFIAFGSIVNTGPQLNLFFLTLSSCALLALTAVLKPYKNKLLNGLEIFHLTILFLISSSNLYVSAIGTRMKSQAYIYIFLVGTCFLVFLGICVGHVWSRGWRIWTQKHPPETERENEEEEDRRPQWHRARVRAEDEEREEVTVSTTVGAINNGEGRDSVFRESVLELAGSN